MEKNTIIIVEDDEITALNLKLSLQKHGYKILAICDTASDAMQSIEKYKPQIVIIDISLQEGNDGITLGRKIGKNYPIPFIYLTSYSDDDIITEAITTEPYGYIVKPFDPSSLHATIQMAIFKFDMECKRREDANASKIDEEIVEKLLFSKRETDRPIVSFGAVYYIDIAKNEIYYNTQKLKLTKKENSILRLLVAKLGSVITFEQAINYVWKEDGATENSIRTLVWRLRSKLPTDIIKNASGIGYYIES
ncbi:MAG: response regulator [Sulfurimonas sp.]|uniref:response regulator transcription factor n=1 Tax=Sulfurimonas sp. TaxID=2022749 RepID=UPI0026347210|nr:response regulator [Sulfurimonas sp.]MDD2651615.1 response regulator [Sulfurimonas sp.]MDD3451426.1 response regulator [Sulfurimonas sp.]